ncbi:signal peptidase II [Kurthia sibirica]|uniref:Lipoprotein signal peptidase n=1 Tax=Kurthia sibirica TaxID=202750 RepID=A0A2U3AQM1_9BACL|nr:signal peptidase II [Kurthia sibirica]PWI26827.1 signal peptidase II [Kurthia sibirica]GEK32635.1 lipoprotein signal peptidase [Kurthia sibirica]
MFKYYLIAIFVIILDQLTKWRIVEKLDVGEEVTVWEPYLSIYSHRNGGAAWGLLQGQFWLFAIITVAVVIGIIFYFHKEAKGQPVFQVSLMLLLGGAIGNFIDRIFRGEVVDFVSVLIPVINYDFPIFNIADAALTIGVIMLIIYVLFEDQKGKKKVK